MIQNGDLAQRMAQEHERIGTRFYPGRLVFFLRDEYLIPVNCEARHAIDMGLITVDMNLIIRHTVAIVLYAWVVGYQHRAALLIDGRVYTAPLSMVDVLAEESDGNCNGWRMKVADNKR